MEIIISDDPFDLLPNEIIAKIIEKTVVDEYFDFIPGGDYSVFMDLIVVLMFVCKRWNEVIRFVYPNVLRGGRNQEVCADACSQNRLGILKWLKQNGANWDKVSFKVATSNGHLGILEFLCGFDEEYYSSRNYRVKIQSSIKKNAIREGHLEILEWIIKSDQKIFFKDLVLAAKNGHAEMVSWMIESWPLPRHIYLDGESIRLVCRSAIKYIKVLKVIEEKGLLIKISRPDLCEFAASKNALESLAWLYQKGFILSAATQKIIDDIEKNS